MAVKQGQAPLPIQREEGLDYTPADQVGAPVGYFAVARSSFELGRMDSSTVSLMNVMEAVADSSKTEDLLSPEELNSEFGTDIFKVPFTKNTAQAMHERHLKRLKLEEVIARGPEGLGTTALSFGSSIAANLLDPLDLAADIAVGKGLGILAKGKRVAMLANWGRPDAGLAREFGEAAAEGFLGNLAVEPVISAAASLENRQRGFDEIAVEALAGALAFPAVKVGGKAVMSRGADFFSGLDTRSLGNLYRSGIAQFRSGKRLNTEPVVREQVRMTSEYKIPAEKGPLWGRHAGYQYTPKTSVSSKDTFYVSSLDSTSDLKGLNPGRIADNYGGVIDATDSAFVANGASARRTGEQAGSVFEVRPKEGVKTFNLERTVDELSDVEKASVAKAYKRATGQDLKKTDVSVRDVMDNLHDGVVNENYRAEVLDEFNASMREDGVDGYIHAGDRLGGMEHSPHNVFVALKDDLLEPVGRQSADADYTGRLNDSESKQILADSIDEDKPGFYQDKPQSEYRDSVEEFEKTRLEEPDVEAEQELVAQKVAQGRLPETILKDMDNLKVEGEAHVNALKAQISCELGIDL